MPFKVYINNCASPQNLSPPSQVKSSLLPPAFRARRVLPGIRNLSNPPSRPTSRRSGEEEFKGSCAKDLEGLVGEPATGGTRSGRFLESGAGLGGGGFGPRRPRGGAGLQPPGKGSASSDPSARPGRSETPRRTPGAVGQPRQGGDHRLPGSWGAALNLRRSEAPKAKTRSGGSRAPSSPGPTCGRSLHLTPSGTRGLCLRHRRGSDGERGSRRTAPTQ